MNILVTGASGFVASHLMPALLAKGFSVRASSRKKTALVGVDWVESPELDASADWRRALNGVDAVIHLAARAHVPSETSGTDVERVYQRINAEGTDILARQAAGEGVAQFLFMSSCHAVASESNIALSEDTRPDPVTAYGRSKLAAEDVIRHAFGKVGGRFTILRPPLVYGSGNLANFARLIALVKSGIPLPFASVRNRRSFIGVQNLSDLILKCLGNEKALDRTFYPSDSADVSTPTLIKSLAEAFEFRARLFPFPEPLLRTAANLPGMSMLRKLMASLYVDSEPLKNDLGWVPALTLDQGLRLIAPNPEEHNRDKAQDGAKK